MWGRGSRIAEGHDYFRRFRALGVWGLYGAGRVVPVSVASRVGVSTHNCQGIATHCVIGSRVGAQMGGCTIRCRCDNAAVVAIIRSGSSRDPAAMHLMRCLFFFTARYQIVLAPAHIPGKLNVAADYLSRDALSSFLQLVPKAKERPASLPEELMEALVVRQPDWTSPTWRSVLKRTFTKA